MEVCTLASSSSGNCTLVSHGDTHILIDAGISLKRVKASLSALGVSLDSLSAVFITHDHSDHISGLPILTKYLRAQIFVSDDTGAAIERSIFSRTQLTRITPGAVYEHKSLSVEAFPTSHDTPGSVGFRITDGARTFLYATDLGIVTREVREAGRGAHFAILEANHDLTLLKNGPYPAHLKRRIASETGHLSNDAGGAFALELASSGTRQIVLAHLSDENNTPALAFDTAAHALTRGGAAVGDDVTLDVAPKDRFGKMYIV
jgi:phosphoribosyl 1,2-cyclic phosphodiesterase